MRYLAIDYGEKYIGLAISDENGDIALPYKTLENKNQDFVFNSIQEVCKKEKIQKIVVGLSLSKQMKLTAQAKITKEFAKELEKFLKLPIEFENELFSTKIIEKNFGRTKRINEAAATIILQSWIDRNRNN